MTASEIIFIVCIVILLLCLGFLLYIGMYGYGGPFLFIYLNRKPICLSEIKYDYTESEITAENRGYKIRGKIFLPADGRQKRGVVIFSHGYGSYSQRFAFIAKSLAMSGLACVTFDFCGGSLHSISEGDTTDMSPVTEKGDLLAVYEKVKALDWVDENKIVLMGESMGGLVSALAASEIGDMEKLVLYYPAFHIAEEAKRRYPSEMDVPEVVKFLGMPIGKRFYLDLKELDVYKEIEKFEGKVLILHGTKDRLVDYSFSERAEKTYNNCKLIPVYNSGHGFRMANEKYALSVVYSFLTDEESDSGVK